MAGELGFYGDPETQVGLTVTATVYREDDSILAANIACLEGAADAIYHGDMPTTAPAGTYAVRFFNGANLLATDSVSWDGYKELTLQLLSTLEPTIETAETGELGFYGDPLTQSGLTVTATIYRPDDSVVASGIVCTEGSGDAIYHGNMPSTPAGTYVVRFFSGTDLLSTGVMYWDGVREVTLDVISALDVGTSRVVVSPAGPGIVTALDIIKSSLRLLQVLGSDVVLTDEEASDGLQALNFLLDSWSNDSMAIYAVAQEVIPLTAGVNPVTWGVGGAFDSVRPTRILEAKARINNGTLPVDIAMKVLSHDDYAAIGIKGLQSSYPAYCYLDNTYPLANLYIWPVPTGTDSLYIVSEKPLSGQLVLSSAISMPPGYLRALKYNLAVELASEYQVTAGQDVIAIAIDSLAKIKRVNYRPQTLQVDPALLGHNSTGRRFNIYSGQ